MRIHVLAGFALFTVLTGAALADSTTDDGWALIRTTTRPNTLKKFMPVITFGIGSTTGMAAKRAVYVTRAKAPGSAALEREIPLDDWRGHRLLLSLRLKNDGAANGWANFTIVRTDTNTIVGTHSQRNQSGTGWQTHQFVMDVPGDAATLVIDAGLVGMGTVWVDGVTLEAVDDDIPVSETRHVINTAPHCNNDPCFN